MLRNIRKFFGVDTGTESAPLSHNSNPINDTHTNIPKARNPIGAPSSTTHALVTSSLLGQVLIVTFADSDINAFVAADINHEIRALYDANPSARHLVLDMENIKFLDSAGLNTLVDLVSMVRQRQGNIAIAAAGQQVEVLFKLTRLELLFKIRRTTMDAINAVEQAG